MQFQLHTRSWTQGAAYIVLALAFITRASSQEQSDSPTTAPIVKSETTQEDEVTEDEGGIEFNPGSFLMLSFLFIVVMVTISCVTYQVCSKTRWADQLQEQEEITKEKITKEISVCKLALLIYCTQGKKNKVVDDFFFTMHVFLTINTEN